MFCEASLSSPIFFIEGGIFPLFRGDLRIHTNTLRNSTGINNHWRTWKFTEELRIPMGIIIAGIGRNMRKIKNSPVVAFPGPSEPKGRPKDGIDQREN